MRHLRHQRHRQRRDLPPDGPATPRNNTTDVSLQRVICCVVMGIVSFAPPATRDGMAQLSDPVQAGADALGGPQEYPWYDPINDQMQAVPPPPVPQPPTIHSNGWRFPEWSSRQSTNTGNFGFWNSWGAFLEVLMWIFVVALLIGLVVLFVRAYLQSESQANGKGNWDPDDDWVDSDKIEQLPFQVEQPRGDLLAEARRLYQAGRYGEAVVYLFSYELLLADKHQQIRLAKGKTNRQYIRELRRRPELVPLLTRTMIAFEDYFFGHHEISRSRFELCWNELDTYRGGLQQSPSGPRGVPLVSPAS